MDLFSVYPGGDRASERSDSEEEHDGGGSVSNISNPSTSWSFGGLIKTLATKSESVISNYRRDLEELGSGLRKETSVIREVASRAVKDLPTTLDVGASVVQESLESVGEAIDDIGSAVWKSTSKIISHGRETFLASDLVSEKHENSSDVVFSLKQLGSSTTRKLEFKQYNRFNTQLIAVQRDLNTYLEEPKDLENYKNWKLGFVLEDKEEEIDNLVKESDDVRETYRTVVPCTIVHEVFWSRYFYRLHKLKQAEEARVKLVKSAISAEDEDDLSWDVDEDDVKEGNIESSGTLSTEKRNSNSSESAKTGDSGDSCKDGDISIISSQLGEEDELGWDEIEDIGIIEEARGNDEQRIGLHKRLIMAEEEEDLSWEIEDEDEPAKA
ncbi:BSD domain-containing protein 1-like [Cucurbita moschata]|uniref:BSD domain-containing protein 1-like n=1 Tax=Cucurbita moschata TaxID=3662 RepID=A0A6J1GTV0_CUCMO|nr:BSD domain-containing protein 1-like [Cucurbita moschata]XP_022955403.1 BSD domain-containing protein 1-like [Cucurbita moschata]